MKRIIIPIWLVFYLISTIHTQLAEYFTQDPLEDGNLGSLEAEVYLSFSERYWNADFQLFFDYTTKDRLNKIADDLQSYFRSLKIGSLPHKVKGGLECPSYNTEGYPHKLERCGCSTWSYSPPRYPPDIDIQRRDIQRRIYPGGESLVLPSLFACFKFRPYEYWKTGTFNRLLVVYDDYFPSYPENTPDKYYAYAVGIRKFGQVLNERHIQVLIVTSVLYEDRWRIAMKKSGLRKWAVRRLDWDTGSVIYETIRQFYYAERSSALPSVLALSRREKPDFRKQTFFDSYSVRFTFNHLIVQPKSHSQYFASYLRYTDTAVELIAAFCSQYRGSTLLIPTKEKDYLFCESEVTYDVQRLMTSLTLTKLGYFTDLRFLKAIQEKHPRPSDRKKNIYINLLFGYNVPSYIMSFPKAYKAYDDKDKNATNWLKVAKDLNMYSIVVAEEKNDRAPVCAGKWEPDTPKLDFHYTMASKYNESYQRTIFEYELFNNVDSTKLYKSLFDMIKYRVEAYDLAEDNYVYENDLRAVNTGSVKIDILFLKQKYPSPWENILALRLFSRNAEYLTLVLKKLFPNADIRIALEEYGKTSTEDDIYGFTKGAICEAPFSQLGSNNSLLEGRQAYAGREDYSDGVFGRMRRCEGETAWRPDSKKFYVAFVDTMGGGYTRSWHPSKIVPAHVTSDIHLYEKSRTVAKGILLVKSSHYHMWSSIHSKGQKFVVNRLRSFESPVRAIARGIQYFM